MFALGWKKVCAVEVLPRPTPAKRTFALGWVTDEDAVECRIGELERNLRLCMAHKAAKVAAYRWRHPEWWSAQPCGVSGRARADKRPTTFSSRSW